MKTDGGYAFPWKEEDGKGGYVSGNGMTLRDYFAAAALTGLLARGTDQHLDDKKGVADTAEKRAILSMIYADEMIAARDK